MGVIIMHGWKTDYIISESIQAKAQNVVLESLRSTYTSDDGKTTFEGNALTTVVERLRNSGLRIPGLTVDQQHLCELLGFKVVRARGTRWYHGGAKGWGVECNCVTL